MRRFPVFLIILGIGVIAYGIFSNPERRDRFLGTIEDSTGVNLDASGRDAAERAGQLVGDAAESLARGLGDAFTDPELHRSLERWGNDALKTLDTAELRRLKQALRREFNKVERDFDSVFEEFLGDVTDS